MTVVHGPQELIGSGFKPSFYNRLDQKLQVDDLFHNWIICASVFVMTCHQQMKVEVIKGERINGTAPTNMFDDVVAKR